MQWSELFRLSAKALEEDLPEDLRRFHWEPSHGMAKAWYGNREIHYELWWRARLHVLEIGLHFEADPLTNARLLAAFRARAKEVRRELGTEARIEEWDRGWARIWEPVPLELPDAELRSRVPGRFSDYVRALEPMLRDELPSDVPWSLGPERSTARRSSARPSRRPRSGRR